MTDRSRYSEIGDSGRPRSPRTLLPAVALFIWVHSAVGQSPTATDEQPQASPLVIAHRGASGYRPEHTLAAYSTAILQGADYIELDLVSTRDGHLIARHDNVLNLTTDVAEHAEFADRRVEKIVDGRPVEGWFSEDFTLEEIGRLRAIERIPATRPDNAQFDGQFGVPTLEEAIALSQQLQHELETTVGLYIELKHSSYFNEIGLPMESSLVRTLRAHGYYEYQHRVFLQSFEISSLRTLNDMTDLKLVQLLGSSGQPFDESSSGGDLTYADMSTAEGLREIATYANGVGPEKYRYLIPRNDNGSLAPENASDFVALAHAAGLLVHPYTFRAENEFLPANYQNSAQPAALGDVSAELAEFLELGIDGFFIDQSDIGVATRDRYLRDR